MAANLDEQLGLRLQEEHKTLIQLGRVVKEQIATMPTANVGPWLDGLRVAFGRMQAHIARAIEMKERDGYLAAMLKEQPTLAKQVDAVKHEHGQLLRLAEGIRDALAATRPDDHMLLADACTRITRFMETADQHDQRENMIALFAFNQDLGGD
jgi:hemerythrin-like domain-containing protein